MERLSILAQFHWRCKLLKRSVFGSPCL